MSMRNSHTSAATDLKTGEYYGLVAKQQTCCQCQVTELHHHSGKRLPHHSHESAYFCFLTEGSYVEYLPGQELEYKPMSLVFHPPHFSHRDEVGPQGGQFLLIEISQHQLDRLAEYGGAPLGLQDLRGTEAVWPALRLLLEFRRGGSFSGLAIEGLLLELLALTARHQVSEKRVPVWLVQVRELIQDEFDQNLSIQNLAQRVEVHPFHLSRVFRQFFGQSVADYLHQIRIQRAVEKLAQPETGLAEVAYLVGFADQSHFTRVFKHLTGVTPGAFRSSLFPN